MMHTVLDNQSIIDLSLYFLDSGHPVPVSDEAETERLVDAVLDDLDFNGDGVIDYGEYLKRQ